MKKKSTKFSTAAICVIVLAACAAGGVYSGYCADRFYGGNFLISYVVMIIMVAFSYLAQNAVHELGHLVLGKASGYDFKSYRLFNLMWQKENDGKTRFYRYSIVGTAGQCIMVPPDTENGEPPYVLYNLGGVLFNLALSAVGLVTALLTGGIFGELNGVLAATGLVIAVINGVPFPGVPNDGSNLLALSRSENARRAFAIQMKGVAMISDGVRVRDMPEEWFRKPVAGQLHRPIEASMAVLVCDRLMDEHRLAEAQEYIDELLENETAIPEAQLGLLRTNAVFCELVGDCDPEKLKKYTTDQYVKFVKAMSKNLSVLRTLYAYALLCNGDEEKAEKLHIMFEKTAVRYPYGGETECEMELVEIAELQYNPSDYVTDEETPDEAPENPIENRLDELFGDVPAEADEEIPSRREIKVGDIVVSDDVPEEENPVGDRLRRLFDDEDDE